MEEKRFFLSRCRYCSTAIEVHQRCTACDILIHDLEAMKRNREIMISSLRVGHLCFEHYMEENEPKLYEKYKEEGVADLGYYFAHKDTV